MKASRLAPIFCRGAARFRRGPQICDRVPRFFCRAAALRCTAPQVSAAEPKPLVLCRRLPALRRVSVAGRRKNPPNNAFRGSEPRFTGTAPQFSYFRHKPLSVYRKSLEQRRDFCRPAATCGSASRGSGWLVHFSARAAANSCFPSASRGTAPRLLVPQPRVHGSSPRISVRSPQLNESEP